MHWGEEYTTNPSSNQKQVAKDLSEMGVNLIIGNHAHSIQPVEMIGDTLVFLKRPDDKEEVKAIITNLVYFNSFLEVTNYYDMKRIYLEDTTKDEYINLMKKFYSDEEVEKYGVVAIEFKII